MALNLKVQAGLSVNSSRHCCVEFCGRSFPPSLVPALINLPLALNNVQYGHVYEDQRMVGPFNSGVHHWKIMKKLDFEIG